MKRRREAAEQSAAAMGCDMPGSVRVGKCYHCFGDIVLSRHRRLNSFLRANNPYIRLPELLPFRFTFVPFFLNLSLQVGISYDYYILQIFIYLLRTKLTFGLMEEDEMKTVLECSR